MPVKRFILEYYCKKGRDDVIDVYVITAGNPNAAAMKLLVEEGNHDTFEVDKDSSYDDVLVLRDVNDESLMVRVYPYKSKDTITYIGTYPQT